MPTSRATNRVRRSRCLCYASAPPLLLLLAAGGCPAQPGATDPFLTTPGDPNAVLTPETLVVTDESAVQVLAISDSQVSLHLSDSTAAPATGQILAGSFDNKPYLRKIVAIAPQPDGTWLADTVQAALSEAISDCDIAIMAPLVVSADQDGVSGKGSAQARVVADKPVYSGEDLQYLMKFEAEPSLAYDLHLVIRNGKVIRLRSVVAGMLDLSMRPKLIIPQSISPEGLAELRPQLQRAEIVPPMLFEPIRVFAGPVPIEIVPVLRFGAGGSVTTTVEGGIELQVDGPMTLAAGVDFDGENWNDNTNWELIGEASMNHGAAEPNWALRGTGEAQSHLNLELAALLYGLDGPTVLLRPSLSVTGAANPSELHKTDVRMRLGIDGMACVFASLIDPRLGGPGRKLPLSMNETLSEWSFSWENRAPRAYSRQRVPVPMNKGGAITFESIDPDGDEVAYTLLSEPTHGLVIGEGNEYLYRPEAFYLGEDSITFKVNDGTVDSNVAVITFFVTDEIELYNKPPVAYPSGAYIDSNQPWHFYLGATDADDDSLKYVIVDAPAHGTVTPPQGSSVMYRPEHGYVGTDSFTFKVSDGIAESQIATVTFNVTEPVNPSLTIEMVHVPGGPFAMGDSFNEGDPDELPVHTVTISPFFIGGFEVTNEQYASALNWAVDQGLVDPPNQVGFFTEDITASTGGDVPYGVLPGRETHPVTGVSWHDAVVFCNWRSQMDGLPLCYDAQWKCNFNLTGYRLPTEAEWEKAARGGLVAARFPWGLNIDGSNANFDGSGDDFETVANRTTPIGYYNGSQVPPGIDMLNGYGLYDSAGNVWEWCNDEYKPGYYLVSPPVDPRGPEKGDGKVVRSGSCRDVTHMLRCSVRQANFGTAGATGFRVVIRDDAGE